MANYTDLNFNFGSVLTATKLQQMQDNFGGLAAGAAPSDKITNSQFAWDVTSGNYDASPAGRPYYTTPYLGGATFPDSYFAYRFLLSSSNIASHNMRESKCLLAGTYNFIIYLDAQHITGASATECQIYVNDVAASSLYILSAAGAGGGFKEETLTVPKDAKVQLYGTNSGSGIRAVEWAFMVRGNNPDQPFARLIVNSTP